MKDDTTRIEATPCPTCGKLLDAATPATDPGTRPSPGDISVCIYCGGLGMYIAGSPVGVRALTPQERDEVITQSPDIRRILAIRAHVVPTPKEKN